MKTVGILNYGTGNLFSISKAVSALECSPLIIDSVGKIGKIDSLILPGIGHFGAAIRFLRDHRLIDGVHAALRDGIPTLGICLGFHILCQSSEEDSSECGLGIFPFKVVRLASPVDRKTKIPQIGWNRISFVGESPKLLESISQEEQIFYYANAYGVPSEQPFLRYASYFHGHQYFALAEQESVFGVQFHPEKSGVEGLRVVSNFLKV